jgi:hypothetical protein
VRDRVAHQVVDHGLQEVRVAGHQRLRQAVAGVVQVRDQAHAALLRLQAAVLDRLQHEVVHRDRGQRALARRARAREHEEALYDAREALELVLGVSHEGHGVGLAPLAEARHLRLGQQHGERRLELVGHVAQELVLRAVGGLDARQRRVELLRQAQELLVGGGRVETLAELGRRHGARRGGQPVERPQRAPGDEPRRQHGRRHAHRHADGGQVEEGREEALQARVAQRDLEVEGLCLAHERDGDHRQARAEARQGMRGVRREVLHDRPDRPRGRLELLRVEGRHLVGRQVPRGQHGALLVAHDGEEVLDVARQLARELARAPVDLRGDDVVDQLLRGVLELHVLGAADELAPHEHDRAEQRDLQQEEGQDVPERQLGPK